MRRNSLFIMLLLAVLLPITISAQQIFQVPVYFWNDVILEQGFVTGESANGADVKFWGATAGNYVLYDASEDLFTVVQTNDNTSGTEVGATVTLTQTGAGAISEGFYSKVIADVQTGSWVNGIVGRVDYSTGSTGDAGGGMAAAICAELNLPARTPSGGAYYAIDLEIEAPENFSSLTSPTTRPMAFMRTGLWGNTTAAADWEDYGYIFHFDDINDLTGNVWYDNTLRVLVNTTAFYIPLSDAQGEYSSAYPIDISNATNSTSPTVGSIQTDGGLGVVLDLYVDGTSNLDNTDIDGTFAADGTTFDVNSTTTVTIDNTNTSNGVVINAVTSGSPISIGHTTSETTVNDNLSVTGDLAVELVANLDNTDIDGTITADGTAFDFNATSTFTMDNTNTTNGIDINTGTDGSPVDIGHSNSEVGIGDNLTVSGDADVVGALTGNTIASDATVVAASTMSTGANSGTSGQITFIASDNDQGTVTINTSDNLTFAGFTGGVDVNGDFTTGTIESDANVTGVTGIFTQTAEGVSLDIGYSATAQVTATGIIDVVRTGDMTGIDAEVYSDINILPDWTFTEPGGGETTTIYGVNIDMTSMETTTGAGESVVTALNLVADTDGDAGANWALQTTGNVEITGATLAAATDNAVNIIATTSISSGTNYAVEISHTNTAGSTENLGALFATTTAGADGSGFMGLMSRVDMDTYNAPTGGANALYGEILLPDAVQNGGEYHVAVLTLAESGASFASSATVNIPTSFIKFETWGGGAEHVDDDDYLFYANGFTAAADHLISLTSQTARVNIGKLNRYMVLSQMQDGLGLGVVGTRMVLTATTDQAIEVFTTSPTSSGNHWANALHHQNSVTTTGTQGVLWVENDVVAQAGGQNAAYFKVDMNAIQAPTGGVSVINAEMVFPTGTQNGGEYHPLVIDIEMPSGADQFHNKAIPSSFMKLEVYGATDDEWNECASLFYLSGITATEGGMFEAETVAAGNADFTHVLRINIGHEEYYIGLNTAKTF